MDARTRVLGPDGRETLTATSILAVSLIERGEHAEAVVLLRTALTAETLTLGADDQGILLTECHLISALLRLGEYT